MAVTVYKAPFGEQGPQGKTALGINDIRHSVVANPTLSACMPNNIGSVDIERAGEAFYIDRYGNQQAASSEDYANQILYSEDGAQWGSTGLLTWTLTNGNYPDRNGQTKANLITINQDVANDGVANYVIETGSVNTEGLNKISFWFKVVSGAVTGLQFVAGNEVIEINTSLSASWHFVEGFVTDQAGSSITSITPICESGSVIAIDEVMFTRGSVVPPYIKTTGSPVTVTNPLSAARQNEKGFLFEPAKTNLVTFSEDLAESVYQISGLSVKKYEGSGPFGDFNQNILLQCNAVSSSITHTNVVLTNESVYSVSLYALVLEDVTDLSVSLGGGESVSFGPLPADSLTRLSVKATASTQNNLRLFVTSPAGNGRVVVAGVQVESGDTTSAIRTAGSSGARPLDLLEYDFEPLPAFNPWSFGFTCLDLTNDTNLKYIFSNAGVGNNEFSASVVNNSLTIKAGGATVAFDTIIDAKRLVVTFDGSYITCYKNGLEIGKTLVLVSEYPSQNKFFIGSDGTNNSALNAHLLNLHFYDSCLSDNEVAVIGKQ